MVSSNPENPISAIKFSSVVPAKVTGNKDHELTNVDLAMKLHYIKAVYFFNSETIQGLTIYDLKEPMFQLLEMFYTTSGRIRRSEATGRPFIKCNDGGVRIVEAFCDTCSVEEWLEMKEDSRDDCLAYNQVLGPDLAFSPLIFVQFTWFKSGGLSLGLSWSHILGDPISASAFVNKWGQIFSGHVPQNSLLVPHPKNPETEAPALIPGKLFPIKRVDPVGDLWQTSNKFNMKTHSFQFTAKQLNQFALTASIGKAAKISHFEGISAVIWKSLSKVRGDSGPGVVTIAKYSSGRRHNEMPANLVELSAVEADFDVGNCNVSELAVLIADSRTKDENWVFEEISERDGETKDFIVYGANLSFVNMEEADVYGLKLQGVKPVFASYSIDGVGEDGVVLVLPGPEEEEEGGCGTTVTVILPENQLEKLKNELKQEWNLG